MTPVTTIGWLVVMMGILLGEPARAETTPEFEDFARDIDASSLRLAPVEEGGRAQAFGVLLRALWGKIGGLDSHPFKGDETFLSPEIGALALWLEPGSLSDVPLIKVDPPLLRGDEGGLASGEMITVHEADALLREMGSSLDPAHRRAAARLDQRMRLLARVSMDIPRLVWSGDEWVAPDDVAAGEDVNRFWNELRTAWAERDAQSVNRALTDLSVLLVTRAGDESPRWRREMEWVLHEWEVWWWSVGIFAGVVLLWLFAGVGDGLVMHRLALGAHGVGLGVLGATVAARGIIAERLPVQNQFEAMTMLPLFIALFGGIWAWRRSSSLIGGVSAGACAVLLASTIVGDVPGSSVERESVMLSESSILGWHVGSMLLAYSAALVGGVGGMLCLLGVRTRGIVRSAVRLTFWSMSIGILLGALWADTAWGRWWAWDAKETWSLVTWCISLAALHACTRTDSVREASGREGRWLSVLAILVLCGVLWTFLGVNLLMRSLHAYAG